MSEAKSRSSNKSTKGSTTTDSAADSAPDTTTTKLTASELRIINALEHRISAILDAKFAELETSLVSRVEEIADDLDRRLRETLLPGFARHAEDDDFDSEAAAQPETVEIP